MKRLRIDPGRFRVGEGEAVHAGVGGQFRAEGFAGAGQVVADADRQAGVMENFVKPQTARGGGAGRLEDHGVAAEQRAGDHAGRQGEGEVERRDHDPDAIGPQHGTGLLTAAAAYRRFVTVLRLHPRAVIQQQIDGLGNFQDRKNVV